MVSFTDLMTSIASLRICVVKIPLNSGKIFANSIISDVGASFAAG